MKISIITVSLNSQNTIKKTIESVLEQDFPPYEYIIVDGDSTDNTLEVIKSYSKDFLSKKIKYTIISEKDFGLYDAMNKGIHLSTGDLIGIINSDDWYEKNALMLVQIEYNREAFDFFYGDINIYKKEILYKRKKVKKGFFITSRNWSHPSSFISKKTYEKVGLFRCQNIYDDFDLFLRIRKSNTKTTIKNVLIANFSLGGISNIKNMKELIKRIKFRYNAYIKNGYSSLYIFESLFTEIVKYFIS